MPAQTMPETRQLGAWTFVAEGSVENQLHTSAAQAAYYGWETTASEHPYQSLPWLGAVVDVSGHYNNSSNTLDNVLIHTDVSRYIVSAGPEVAWSGRAVRPFARFQLGVDIDRFAETLNDTAASATSSTNFAMLSGGGADVKITHAVGIRAQCDWIGSWVSSLNHNDYIRTSAGVVFHF